MRRTGHVLMWIGFLAAAFLTTRQLDAVNWGLYLPAAVVGIAGVAILRRTAGQAASHGETVRENLSTLEASLGRLVTNIETMNRDRETIHVYDVHKRIDGELIGDLASFAEARESMIHGIGLQEYAQVMDHFARAERAVNRAWSASADGYVDEVWTYLGVAERSMRKADGLLKGYLQTGSPA
jgi:hypothetical protein